MTCSCPKCAAHVEIDLPHIPEDGTSAPCPECNKRFWIHKESFARRILKKEGKLYCVKCGHELGSSIACTACGAVFPDYYAVLTAKPARRKIEKSGFSIGFTPRQVKQSYAVHHQATAKPQKALLTKIALVVLVAVLLVGAGVFYRKMKAEQHYTQNFSRAIYGIKVGTELSVNACAKVSGDWRAKADTGQGAAPRIAPSDEPRLNTIQEELDRIMPKLNTPPEKFAKANEKLARLYGTYAKLHSLALAPSGSLAGFIDAANKAENEYRQAVQELKTGLPSELSEELEKAKKKYKGLQNF